jgi:hypothetical protein
VQVSPHPLPGSSMRIVHIRFIGNPCKYRYVAVRRSRLAWSLSTNASTIGKYGVKSSYYLLTRWPCTLARSRRVHGEFGDCFCFFRFNVLDAMDISSPDIRMRLRRCWHTEDRGSKTRSSSCSGAWRHRAVHDDGPLGMSPTCATPNIY